VLLVEENVPISEPAPKSGGLSDAPSVPALLCHIPTGANDGLDGNAAAFIWHRDAELQRYLCGEEFAIG
jgi:hypothetical protein